VLNNSALIVCFCRAARTRLFRLILIAPVFLVVPAFPVGVYKRNIKMESAAKKLGSLPVVQEPYVHCSLPVPPMTEICCIQDDGLYKRQKNMEEDGAVASITCNSLRSGTFRVRALIAKVFFLY
jgi:hypothetical protein